MLKNRSIQVSVVKDHKNPATAQDQPVAVMTKEDATDIAKDIMVHTAKTIVAVMAVHVVLHTASEILIRALETPEDKKKETK